MEYYKVQFVIKSADGSPVADEWLLQSSREVLSALAGEAGFESFEDTADGVDGYVQKGLFARDVLDSSLAAFPMEGVNVSYQLSEADHRNWNETWEKEGFEPIVVGNRCVIHDNIIPYTGEPMPVDVMIEARQAFGTGTHATTRLMVSQLLDLDLSGKRVLDCGCGTGILSIVASKCGARQVVGYDIDEWSVENTQHNASLNGVDNLEVLHGDVHVLSHVNGVFDVVMANINRNILLSDMSHFVEVLSMGGHLLMSGFYASDSIAIAECAGRLGLSLVKAVDEDDWCCLSLSHV